MTLGHESAGTISEVGPAVTRVKVGDRVALEPGAPCRHCEPCLSGFYNLCIDMHFAATPPYDGTLTGFYVAPEDFCYKLPEHVSLQEGALVEPLAVAIHIVRQAAVTPGQSGMQAQHHSAQKSHTNVAKSLLWVQVRLDFSAVPSRTHSEHSK